MNDARVYMPTPLTIEQFDNILAAYRGLQDKNPFFSFNAETQAIIDLLERCRDSAVQERDK